MKTSFVSDLLPVACDTKTHKNLWNYVIDCEVLGD